MDPSLPLTSSALAAFLVTKMTMSTDGCPWPARQLKSHHPIPPLEMEPKGGAQQDPTLSPHGPQSSSPDPGIPHPRVPKPTLSSCTVPLPSLPAPHQTPTTALVCAPWTGGQPRRGLLAGLHSQNLDVNSGVSMCAGPDDEAQTPGQTEGWWGPESWECTALHPLWMRGKTGLKPSRQAGDTEWNFTPQNYKRGFLCSQVASVLLVTSPKHSRWSRLNNVPQRCSPLKPWGAWDYVTLQDKRIFTGIKLKI